MPAKPPVETQFKAGMSGNPGGKPVGARNRITTKFLHALAEDFEEHGKKAIQATRDKDPAAYMKVCAGLLPKQIEQTKPLDDLSDADILALLDYLRGRIAQNSGSGAGTSGEPTQTH